MKPQKPKHYIDAYGVPHGDWWIIIRRNLAKLNEKHDKLYKGE